MFETTEKLKPQESIIERQEIEAPEGYVSVFHETTEESLSGIDLHGLQHTEGNGKNIGISGDVARKNTLIDQDRPEHLKLLGVSRVSNFYAYPFLSEGHGLHGADLRFIERPRPKLDDEYHTLQKYGAEVLASMGVTSADEYATKMQDPDYLKQEHPGEIVELKVDPARCFVGDLTRVTNVFDGINRWGFEPGDARGYWESLVTLEDFLKWYKKPEWAEDGNSVKDAGQFREGEQANPGEYCPIAGAPDNFPWSIMQPEILIPDNVPQERIRLIH